MMNSQNSCVCFSKNSMQASPPPPQKKSYPAPLSVSLPSSFLLKHIENWPLAVVNYQLIG